MKTKPQQISLSSIELHGSGDLLRESPLRLAFPESNLCLVLGENGSGKSLIATVISSILSSDDLSSQLADFKHAGLQQIRLEFRVDSDNAVYFANLETGEHRWESPGDEHQSFDSNGLPSPPATFPCLYKPSLFRQLHFIVNGYQELPLSGEIDEIGRLLRKPLDRERDSWRKRLTTLSGETGQGGQLRRALDACEKAKTDLEGVRELLSTIEEHKVKQRRLNNRLTELVKTGAVLKVEREEIERKAGLAERAARIDTWLSEVRCDIEKVEALREEHASAQEDLDRLSSRFREAPEHFPDLLSAYSSATEVQQQYRQAWEELERRRAEASEEIRDIEQQMEKLSSPVLEGSRARLTDMRNEIQADESELMDLLRDRISLVRRRDGIESRLRSDFQELHEAGSAVRDIIRRYCEKAAETQSDPQTPETQKTKDEIDIISAQLKESFAGFDALSDTAEEELKDLFYTRKVVSDASDMLEGLQTRKLELEASGKGHRWTLAAIAAGFAVGIPVGILGGWDIGLFAALISSGVIWLAYRNARKAIEQKQSELSGHERKLRVRWSTSVEARQLLETHLRPLAHARSLPDATARLADYRKLTSDLTLLQSKLDKTSAPPDPEFLALQASLPEAFRKETPARLTLQLREYRILSAEFEKLEKEWEAFESGGDIANRIEQLESQISRRKREAEETERTHIIMSQQYSDRKRILAERMASLQKELPSSEQIEDAAVRLRDAEEKQNKLVEESGQVLKDADAAVIETEWNRLQDLRTRQRVLKDELSARLALDEIRSRQSILSDELHDVTEQLSELDPLYLTQGNSGTYAEKYLAHLDETSQQISDNLAGVETLRSELKLIELDKLTQELSKYPSLHSLEAELEAHEQSAADIQRETHTTEELIESLDRELMELDDSMVNRLQDSVNRILHLHFDGSLGAVKFADNEWLLVSTSGQTKRLRALSRGQSDLLRLVIQAGILNFLGEVETGFTLWDDVLGTLDERYLAGMKNLVSDLATNRQVILLTRDARFRDWGETAVLGMSQSVHS